MCMQEITNKKAILLCCNALRRVTLMREMNRNLCELVLSSDKTEEPLISVAVLPNKKLKNGPRIIHMMIILSSFMSY